MKDKMNNIDEFFQSSQYSFIRIVLSACGLWPFHTVVSRCMIYFAMILILGFGLTFQMMGAMEIRHDFFVLLDCAPSILIHIHITCVLILMVYKLPEIKLLLIKIQKYYLSQKSNEEYKIHNSHATYGRKLTMAYMGIQVGIDILFVFMTALERLIGPKFEYNASFNEVPNVQTGILFRVNYMVDFDTYYVPIFLHTTVVHISYILIALTIDILYVTLVEYCCGLFTAIRFRLENAFEFENNSNDLITTSTMNKSYSNIAYSIRRHTEAIQFVTIIESTYSMSLFLHVACCILLLSIMGYQIVTNMEKMENLLAHVIQLITTLLYVFFFNWQGQKIIDYSGTIFESAYNTEWYNMPIAARKLLIMIMAKSKKSLTVNAANKLIVMSYVTFNAMLRMSMSYFMLLRSLQ